MTTAVVTVAAKNYLASVRVLAASLRRTDPSVPLFVGLVDEPDGRFSPSTEQFDLLPLLIDSDGWRRTAFRSMTHELACALKPVAIRRVLDLGFDTVLFLDPDVLIVSELGHVIAEVARHDVTLTPHLLQPRSGDDAVDRERTMVQCGTCNAGFVGVRRSEHADAFLRWWSSRVRAACRHDLAAGVFDDQRWLDLAPGMFEGVALCRDPTWNVAYWDLPERDVTIARFVHFSGYDPTDPAHISVYTNRLGVADLGPEGSALYRSYATALLEAGHVECREWPSSFASFDDGTPVPQVARLLHGRLTDDDAASFGDPFATRKGSWFDWLTSPAAGAEWPQFWVEVHRERADLQAAFPAPDGAEAEAFGSWIAAFGIAETGASGPFLPGERRR